MACWEFRVEIGKFLNEHYSPSQIKRALTSPNRNRIETIIELIEEAKKLT